MLARNSTFCCMKKLIEIRMNVLNLNTFEN